ncbi:MAG: polyprenyl synthetase family protein [Christensenellales bacterium]
MHTQQYEALRSALETYMDGVLPLPDTLWPEDNMPRTLVEAMRYSLLAGGKRLRPVLLLAAYGLYHPDITQALPFAAAVEMIHTYSLIHDDLPAMDDDDLRRGGPTSHIQFGEATAILAGDALLTMAFELMAQSKHPRALPALGEIALRAGARGMIAGQSADLAQDEKPDVAYIHQHKTADLLTAPVVAGLLLADAPQTAIQAGKQYGYHLGLAFQIADDLLDLEGDEATLGKRTHKDAEAGKCTWPQVHGVEKARRDAFHHAQLAQQAAQDLGRETAFFVWLAHNAVQRVQ